MSKIVFNENDLTIGDLEDFEDSIGQSLTEALKPIPVRDDEGNVVRHNCETDECETDPCKENGRPLQTVQMNAKVLKGIVWISKRMADPEFTLADARKVKVTELDIVRSEDEDTDPKESADSDN